MVSHGMAPGTGFMPPQIGRKGACRQRYATSVIENSKPMAGGDKWLKN